MELSRLEVDSNEPTELSTLVPDIDIFCGIAARERRYGKNFIFILMIGV